jgi:aspartate kinase
MAKTVIYKFGGASVKDASAVRNLAEILRNRLRKNFIIVVSAMGKTTNAIESLILAKLEQKDFYQNSTILKSYHLGICQELFPENHSVFSEVENIFIQLNHDLELPLSQDNYDEFYDRVICCGELLATRIVTEFLCTTDLMVVWKDARKLIQTDSSFRFAKINWDMTKKKCQSQLLPILEQFTVVTQGFIGADPKGRTTTLGREGSDFTAAILGSILNASSVTIWKDVPGILNADPKLFPNTQLFDELEYRQAAEMTYYGASVIHPKTIKPLANSNIPLFVKSFLNPEAAGTKIFGEAKSHQIPTIILKENQVLVSFKVKDFTFIEEHHIHQVYDQLQQLKLRVNMLQTSAITISIVIDTQLFKLEQLLNRLKEQFEIRYNEGLTLLTILHPNPKVIAEQVEWLEILLEQSTRTTYMVVCRSNQS